MRECAIAKTFLTAKYFRPASPRLGPHYAISVIPCCGPLRSQANSDHSDNVRILHAVFGENERVPLINDRPIFDQLAAHIGDVPRRSIILVIETV